MVTSEITSVQISPFCRLGVYLGPGPKKVSPKLNLGPTPTPKIWSPNLGSGHIQKPGASTSASQKGPSTGAIGKIDRPGANIYVPGANSAASHKS